MTLTRIRFLLSLLGLTMALVAVILSDRTFTWVALAVLGVAFGLRFIKQPPESPPAA